jgi:hypothetical protein
MVKSIRSRCHIGITILIAVLCGMLLLGVPCLRQSRRNPAPFLQLANTSSPDSLAQFGRMAGWKHGDIVVYSLADSNFREEMLQQFHAAQTFGFQYAVLCIDDSCMATCRSRMLLCYDGVSLECHAQSLREASHNTHLHGPPSCSLLGARLAASSSVPT